MFIVWRAVHGTLAVARERRRTFSRVGRRLQEYEWSLRPCRPEACMSRPIDGAKEIAKPSKLLTYSLGCKT